LADKVIDMGKGDIIGWAAILGGIGLLGYLGYKGVKSLFPFGGNGGGYDIFGNPTLASVQETAAEYRVKGSESTIAVAEAKAQMDLYEYDPTLETAFYAYNKEMEEYNALLEAWSPTYSFWTGKESKETQEYRARMIKEHGEALAAYAKYHALWEAQYA